MTPWRQGTLNNGFSGTIKRTIKGAIKETIWGPTSLGAKKSGGQKVLGLPILDLVAQTPVRKEIL